MHKNLLLLSFLSYVAFACQPTNEAKKITQPKPVSAPTGTYVGLDEMEGMPPEKPGDKWYHENIVYIRPDSLYLEGNPIIVSKDGEKGYSSSDGGFYSYKGRIDSAHGQLKAQLLMFSHDYIGEPILIKSKDTAAAKNLSLEEAIRRGLAVRDSSFYKKTYNIHLLAKGFEMDGVHYIPLRPDSLPNVFPVGFPDAKRFFGQAHKGYR
jgi:hypothetical protein